MTADPGTPWSSAGPTGPEPPRPPPGTRAPAATSVRTTPTPSSAATWPAASTSTGPSAAPDPHRPAGRRQVDHLAALGHIDLARLDEPLRRRAGGVHERPPVVG